MAETKDNPSELSRHSGFCPGLSGWAAVAAILFIVFALLGPELRTSADIRLDTGDLRYRYLGIPLVYERMPEPQRSQMQLLAAKSNVLRPTWCQCARFPNHSTNNTDAMCRGWYFNACVWASQEPQLARIMLEDVANYIVATKATTGLPDSNAVLSGFVIQPDAAGKWALKPGWEQNEWVQDYLQMKNYHPTTAPSR